MNEARGLSMGDKGLENSVGEFAHYSEREKMRGFQRGLYSQACRTEV